MNWEDNLGKLLVLRQQPKTRQNTQIKSGAVFMVMPLQDLP
jgi:hypothetical protein